MKRAISLILALIILLPVTVSADGVKSLFSDTVSGAWYDEAVVYSYKHGYIQGTAEGVFSPSLKLTRAMSARMLYTISGDLDEYPITGFVDVKDGNWFKSAVEWAYAVGITEGTSQEKFSPNLNITRQDFAAMLYRYDRLYGHTVVVEEEPTDITQFTDCNSVSFYAEESFNWALKFNIINGYPDNTLRPKGNITRAEAAVMLYGYDMLLGHSWSEKVITERSCTADGLSVFTCERCETVREVSLKGYHVWSKGVTVTEAGCLTDGKKKYSCFACGETKSEIIKAKGYHSWNSFIITKDATCVETGIRKYICSDCKGSFEQIIPITPHSWDSYVVIKNESCTEDGEREYICSVCDGRYRETVAAKGHSWDSFVIIKAATCVETGIRKYTCSRCNGSFEQVIPMISHSWDSFEITKQPSCTEEGQRKYSCSICKGSFIQAIAKTPHDWVIDQEVKGNSCIEPGTIKYKCTVCNGSFVQSSYNGPHNWVKTTTVLATQNYKGSVSYKCSHCSADKTEVIDRLPRTEGYDSNNDGMLTIDEYLGAFGMVDMLIENQNDYLGTKYVALKDFINDPYMLLHNKGQYPDSPGMNCTGFIASAMLRSGGNLNKISRYYGGAFGNGYNWLRTVFNAGIKHYKFYSIQSALNSGLLKKGDIMFFVPPAEVPEDEIQDCHFGIFWGDTPSHDLMWHSTCASKYNYAQGVRGMKNQITRISSGTLYDYILVFPLQR